MKITNHKSQITNIFQVIFLLLLILLTINSIGQTHVPNDEDSYIDNSITWSDPVYHIHDDIIIENGATLTIEDGVQLIFFDDNGSYGSYNQPEPNDQSGAYISARTGIFITDGAIEINGIQNSKVFLTADNTTTGWEGINIYGDGTVQNNYNLPSIINYAIIEYVIKEMDGNCNENEIDEYKHGAINLFKYNNIIIQNSIIRNNQCTFGGGICVMRTNQYLLTKDYPKIINNSIYDNYAKRGGGICVLLAEDQFPLIQNNEIYNNTATYDAGGIAIFKKSKAIIQGNSIYNNSAECLGTTTQPYYTGGGGIVIGLKAFAKISENYIGYNNAIFNPNTIYDESGFGGGILFRIESSAEIHNNEIIGNNAENGAGIAVLTTKPSVYNSATSISFIQAENNQINYNYANSNGGGIYLSHAFAEITFNDINNNIALDGRGGGIYIKSNSPNIALSNNQINIYLNHIYSNFASTAGGIFADGYDYSSNIFPTKVNIINNIIYENQSVQDGAGIVFGSNWLEAFINNNTITQNYTIEEIDGNAIYIPTKHSNSKFSFTNNLMFYNQGDCQIFYPGLIPDEFIQNDIMNLGCIQINPDNNFDLPPEFIDLPNNNYQLQQGSPLIDLGDNNVFPIAAVDIANNNRIINEIDIGAYENNVYFLSTKININSNVYPNPASNLINISSDDIIYNIKIYNTTGTLVFLQSNIYKQKLRIDISNLNKAFYIIKLETDKGIVKHKFIKQ